jgi:hypothetical protein
MSSKSNKKHTNRDANNPGDTVSNAVGNYEKHPFFIKKTGLAKAFLSKVGLPKQLITKTSN